MKNLNLKTWLLVVCIAAAAGCAAQGGVAEESEALAWKVEPVSGGYLVSLPADLIAGYPDGTRVELALGDDARGETSVTGVAATLSATRLLVRTDQALEFTDGSYVHVRNADTCAPADENVCPRFGSPWCHGCPRDPRLAVWNGNESICYCYNGPPVGGT